jgi:2-keto-4-pentenoate hydratase/2-oxohepta-3-ene-1,7-dioic acid hydratase in catechol pathway
MRFARYTVGGQVSYGIVEGDTLRDINAPPWEQYQATGPSHKLSDVQLLCPTAPVNLMTTGVNARSHAESEQNAPQYSPNWLTREDPSVSLRSVASIVGHETNVIRPQAAPSFREECELVVVIGKNCRNVSREDVPNYVLGYTVGNDWTIKEFEYEREAWRAKNCDTMHAIGPWIETDFDPSKAVLKARVAGVETQNESMAGFRFTVQHLISYISKYMTLYPGDLVYMGTVGEPGDSKVGDTVEVEIEGIGVLRNRVIGEE